MSDRLLVSVVLAAGSRGANRRHPPFESITMRTVLNILGAVLLFLGVVWFLQGINILPGSFMTGQLQWAAYGAIAGAIGVVLLMAARRIAPRRSD